MHRSKDPDPGPSQNVMDPEHCRLGTFDPVEFLVDLLWSTNQGMHGQI